ncbi:MAG: hypothetical protein EOP14_04650 [Pseudomonas sp.]|nr:MAG: hypothetical protein EOP14_04650 [Pseudomonas sp.]
MFDREVGSFAGPVATARPSGHLQLKWLNPSTPAQVGQRKAKMVTPTCKHAVVSDCPHQQRDFQAFDLKKETANQIAQSV